MCFQPSANFLLYIFPHLGFIKRYEMASEAELSKHPALWILEGFQSVSEKTLQCKILTKGVGLT